MDPYLELLARQEAGKGKRRLPRHEESQTQKGCDNTCDKARDNAVTTKILSRDNKIIVTPFVTPIVTPLIG